MFHPSRQNRTHHRRDLASAEPAKDLERIGKVGTMQGDGALDRQPLALESARVDTGAGPDPIARGAEDERSRATG